MLTERRRVLGLLADRRLWPIWLGRFVGQTAEWLFLLILLLAAWTQTREAAVVGWVLAARLLPRAVLSALPGRRLPRGMRLVVPMLLVAEAVIAAWVVIVIWLPARVIGSFGLWMIVGALLVGTLATLAGAAQRGLMLKRLDRRIRGAGVLLWAAIDRAAVFTAAVVASLLVLMQFATVGLAAIVGVTFVVAAVPQVIGLVGRDAGADTVSAGQDRGKATNRIDLRRLLPYSAAFGGGALASAVLAGLFVLWSGDQVPSAVPLILAAVVGAGMLAGPMPVPRLLLRIPAPVLIVSTSAVVAVAALAAVVSGTLWLAVPALFVLGIAAITQDSVRAIVLRRVDSVADYRLAARGSVLALALGQIVGALAIATSSASVSTTVVVVAVAVGQLLLVGGALVMGGRSSLQIGGLSSLPIKSVVHKLSWETRPPAGAADFAGRPPRVRRLSKWINRCVNLELLQVTLPVSKRAYKIYRPDEASRERLFEQGRADPDKQMPYWAKVWPSGVALADVVVERKSEVADKHVLELGAGLGVTAAAVLEHGGHIVTADYSALPLAHCRLNAMVNTDRTPRATRFNWRHDDEVTAATSQPEFRDGFPLIIAGDVLYEGRDAEPLLNVIERLLVADGSLWLAEPVRRTAQRFLDSAAALGWEIDSRQVQADWPDATNGPVNLHFLTRSVEPDKIVADLGGWRI